MVLLAVSVLSPRYINAKTPPEVMPRFKYLQNYQPNPLLETPPREEIVEELKGFNPTFTAAPDPTHERVYQRLRHVQTQYFVGVIELRRQGALCPDPSLDDRCRALIKAISGLEQLQGTQELAIIRKFASLWLGGEGLYDVQRIYNSGVQIYRAHRHVIERAKAAGQKTEIDMQRFAPSDLSSRLETATTLRPVIAESDEFRKAIVLEQIGRVVREIKKQRAPYAQIEARILSAIACEAKDFETQDVAKRATKSEFGPLAYHFRQVTASRQRPA